MLKKLLIQLFVKLENERDNDKKTKNGNSIYFVEKILEEKFGKVNYIAAKTIKSYYEKYVESKENKSGEPSSELKGLMASYLGYRSFLDFENKNKSISDDLSILNPIKQKFKKNLSINSSKIIKWSVASMIILAIPSALNFNEASKGDCIIWEINHYVKVDCEKEFSLPIPKNLNIKTFKKVKISEINNFFIKGNPVIWYSKSTKGKLEYFNSRGIHPITGKELKPITQYIIDKYIYNKK